MLQRGILSFINKFRALDVFTKPLDDFQEKTLYGGLGQLFSFLILSVTSSIIIIYQYYAIFVSVTIFCWITIFYLTFCECYDYLKSSWKEEIFVDVSAGSKLQINLDIIITDISCDCKFRVHRLINKYFYLT